MKSISEFERLYKVNIPFHEKSQYYIDTLLKSAEFNFIPSAIKDFEELESILGDKTIKVYKQEKMDEVIDYIEKSTAYYNYMRYDIQSLPKPTTKDERNKNFADDQTGKFYLSVDISKANYSIFKNVFAENNELGKDWNDFMNKLNVHPALGNSKSFRQYIFGNISPNRNQRIQQHLINQLVDQLMQFEEIQNNPPIYITHDEIILQTDQFPNGRLEYIISKCKELWQFPIPTKFSWFKIERIGERKKLYIERHLNSDGSFKYSSLFGVAGNQFYYYFKKYILKEPLILEDLYFYNDEKLAIWVVNPDQEKVDNKFISAATSGL